MRSRITKNVIILNDYATVNGGASKVAITTANGLAERGYQVFYFAGVGPVNPDLYRSKNIHVICLDQFDILGDPIPLRAAFTGIWNSRAVQEFKKLSQELDLKNTIVNLHSWTKNLTASIVRQCIQKDISTVVTLHDYFLACPNGGFYNFQKVKPCPLIGLSIACLFEDCDQRNYSHKLWRFTRQLAQKKLGRLPDGLKNFIALSDFSLRILQPYLPEKCNLWQVYNPIEITKQPPVDVEKNNTFIVLGRLAPEKGSYFFTRAAKQAGVEILLVGDGPERATIENEYSSENITGWLPHHEAIDKLNQARVHVLPSLCYEVSPLAVYEAAAKGVPSIVPTTSAACKFIKDGETGLLFTGGDEHSLVEKILRFTKPGEAQRMGLSAYNTYWKNPCSIESYLEKLENIFSEILKQT